MCGNRTTFSRTETKYFAGGTQVESGQLREITEMQFARLFPHRTDGYTTQSGAKRTPIDQRALWAEAKWRQIYTEKAQAAIASTQSWQAKTADAVRAAGGVDAWVRQKMTELYSEYPEIGIPKQRFLVMNSSPPQAIDRVVKWEKTETPTSCGPRCRMARGPMCDCVCEGKNHGAGATMSRETKQVNKETAARTAARKATMANELFRVRIGNGTVSSAEFMEYARRFVPNVSRNDFLPTIVEKVNAALAARGDSIRVSILMKGQDFSRVGTKARFSNGERNRRLMQVLANADRRIANQVVSNIAAHYGIPTQQVFGEIFDANAEELMEYVTEPVRSAAFAILQQKGLMSRSSAKAAFGQNDAYTTSLNKPVTVANCNRMMNIASEAIQYAKSVGDNELLDLAEEVGIECQAIKSRASRFGAKAAFAANDVDLWNLLAKSDVVLARQNANELATLKKYAQKALRMPNFTPPAMAQHGPSLHQIATDTLADIQAFEQAAYRYRNRAPWEGSRAKAAFDAFNPFTAPAKPASWDGKRINLNDKMYKVEPNGGAYDLYDMNTNKKAKTVTAEQLYRAWSQGRITSIYSRSGAKETHMTNGMKAAFDKNTIVESWTSPKGTRYEAGLWQSYGGTYQPYVTATYSDGGEQLMTLNEKSYATESGARKRLAAVVSRMKSNYSRVGAKAKFEIKVGDRALGSLAAEGGAGVIGTVFKIEDGYAHILGDPSVDDERWGRKTYKVPLRLVTRMSRSGAAAAFGNEGIQKGLSRLLKETGFKAMSQDILKGGSDAETLRKYIRVLKSKMSPLHGDERAAQLLDTLERQLMSRSGAKEKFGQVTQLLGYIESQAHDQRELAKSNLRKLAENIGRIDHTDAEWKHFVRVAHSLGFTDSQIAGFSRRGAKVAFAEPKSFKDLVAYARFHFNLNLYQAQDVAGRAGIFLTMHPNKYPLEMVMQEALKRSNAALTAEQKAPDYRVGSNIKGNPTMRDSSLVMSRSSAKAMFAEELIQKLSGGWEIVKIDGILHLAKGNEAIPVPSVQRAMELHKASTEGRLMKQNVAGTKTQAFSRVGEEEAFSLGAASETDDPAKDENLIALSNRVGREHTVNLFKCWSEGKASMQRAATMFSANMYYSVQATVGNNAVGERTAQTVEEAKRFAYSMLDAAKQNAGGKTVVVDVIPVKNYEPQASVLTLRG
jgi:hypothetical protein